MQRIHLLAGLLATLAIASFFSVTLISELLGSTEAIVTAKALIVMPGLFLLIPAIAADNLNRKAFGGLDFLSFQQGVRRDVHGSDRRRSGKADALLDAGHHARCGCAGHRVDDVARRARRADRTREQGPRELPHPISNTAAASMVLESQPRQAPQARWA